MKKTIAITIVCTAIATVFFGVGRCLPDQVYPKQGLA